MARGEFEPVETQIIRAELQKADVFIDVGANIGFYSCLSRALGVPTVAIEPLPQNLTLLFRNLRNNGFTDVEVIPVGLAERPGIKTLHGGGTGASLVSGWAGTAAGWHRDIAISTFDRLILPIMGSRRALIKLDVEGAELGALNGAKGLLVANPAPVWLVEVNLDEHHPAGRNPDYRAIFELFFNAGYRAFIADAKSTELDSKAVRERELAGGSPVHNYVFRKADVPSGSGRVDVKGS